MFSNRKVTFVEELPDIDETPIIENYEHSQQKHVGPPPPQLTKNSNTAYSYYGNVYGGPGKSQEHVQGQRQIPTPTTKGDFKEESREKDLLLEKAVNKLPSRRDGRTIAPDKYEDEEVDEERRQHSHAHPYIIYEENPQFLPRYTVPGKNQRQSRPQQRQSPPQLQRQLLQPQQLQPSSLQSELPRSCQIDTTSVCSMINKHLNSCVLCSKLYTSNINTKTTTSRKNMSVVFYIIVIILLVITCIVLFRKLFNAKQL